MVKKFSVAILCMISFGVFAQNGTISPYSFFGIGDSREGGTVENQMMGGLRMYADSIHVNLRNPAAYSELRLTAYSVGLSHREFRLKDFTEQQNTSVTNLDYLAIGLPVAKDVGVGFGIMPYSSVGYSLVQNRLTTEGDSITNVYSGEGGINRVYASIGFRALKNLTLGATANFNFGTLQYNRIQTIQDVQFGTLDARSSRINGFDFNYTANFTPKITEKLTLFSHLGVNTQLNLVSKNEEEIGSFNTQSGQNIELVEVDLEAQNLRNTELKIPTVFTGGLGIGENKKWFLGAEYSAQQLSTFENAFLRLENVEYQDASTISVGGYYIPNYTSFSNVLNRITYRAGLRYDQTGMIVNGKEINNFGITFGFGVPLVGVGTDRFSNLNIGFELGRRGTTDANLVEESYFRLNLGLSFNSKWFQKRQID
ncbi:hypothetical protein [Croceivirga thetidis]|uniref:Long-chain fatty acid transport protein n=1 Tax=Croceivirga thetidis TaxID=2721623 RepID=A0ABX1GRX4_9FLAO|nr:hypothetical protein [Croceivirga thetidis]NKI31680.1 hypothetical protein [Croceivirga thetidis]